MRAAILDSLIDERRRLQRGVPDVALLEANRLAIVYWQRELAQAAAAERADPETGCATVSREATGGVRSCSHVKRLQLDEIEGIPVLGTLHLEAGAATLGVTAFGINAYTAANAGDEVVEEHTEEQLGHEEIYVVVAGHATSRSTARRSMRPPGTLVYLDDVEAAAPCDREGGRHDGARDRRHARAHEISAWEYFFPALPRDARGRLRHRAAHPRRGARRRRTHRCMHYQLACVEALAGKRSAHSTSSQIAVDAQRAVSRARARRTRTSPRSATIRAFPRNGALPGAGQAHARRAQRRHRVGLGPRDEQHGAVPGSRTSESTRSCRPSASANALCHCSPPNGTSCSSLASPAIDVAPGDGAHRDVDDDRLAVRARDADRERVRAGELRPPRAARAARGEVAVSTRDEAGVGEPPHVVAEHPGRERALADDEPRMLGRLARSARRRRARARGSRWRRSPSQRSKPSARRRSRGSAPASKPSSVSSHVDARVPVPRLAALLGVVEVLARASPRPGVARSRARLARPRRRRPRSALHGAAELEHRPAALRRRSGAARGPG